MNPELGGVDGEQLLAGEWGREPSAVGGRSEQRERAQPRAFRGAVPGHADGVGELVQDGFAGEAGE